MGAFNIDNKEFWQLLNEITGLTSEPRKIKKDYDISKNVNSQICSECGGQCCKRCGCQFSPDDFEEISFDFLKKEIEKGYISIENMPGKILEQRESIYILRTRNQGAGVVDTCYEDTPCVLLTENGCKLDYEHRPTGARLLVPSKKRGFFTRVRKCYPSYSIADCCFEWKEYQDILHQLVKYFEEPKN